MIYELDSLPDNEPYLWADYLEIWATVCADKCFSRGDLSSIGRAQAKPKSRQYCDDKWQYAISFIDTRIALFGNDYPFYLSDDRDTIFIKQKRYLRLSSQQRLYLALLFCANIKYINRDYRHLFTSSFEKISYPIFANLMPVTATVHFCWASAGSRAHYTGLLFDKLKKIAHDFRCTPNFTLADFKPNDRGDGGIDILAWHDMGDNRESIPIALAQCGCSKDEWVAKQLEASPAKMHHMLPVIHPWATYYFLPQDLRWHNTSWAHKSDIGAAIFVDRLRIMRLSIKLGNIRHHNTVAYVRKLLSLEVPLI